MPWPYWLGFAEGLFAGLVGAIWARPLRAVLETRRYHGDPNMPVDPPPGYHWSVSKPLTGTYEFMLALVPEGVEVNEFGMAAPEEGTPDEAARAMIRMYLAREGVLRRNQTRAVSIRLLKARSKALMDEAHFEATKREIGR